MSKSEIIKVHAAKLGLPCIDLKLNVNEVTAIIGGLNAEISEFDCGLPGDDVWVASHQGLIARLEAIDWLINPE